MTLRFLPLPSRPLRRIAACLLLAGTPMAAVAGATPDPTIQALSVSLWPEAEAAGVTRATFEAAFAGLAPDPSVAAMTARQPEFAKPIGAYLAAQVTPARVAQGRALMARWAAPLAAIERRSGVPAAIVVAVWGLESNYGAAMGGKDVIRSLATLAAAGYRPALYRGELVSAMQLVQSGAAGRAQLRGSWAGAMGQPQFMPSSYTRYAVDGDGDGRADIWGDVPDVLASIANFLALQGWQRGVPWGFEVRLPAGFDVSRGRGRFADWAARGLARADGGTLPPEGEAALFFPAGASGPAFLVSGNYEVLKTYNFSDAYVLSVALLAGRMEGGAPVVASWPGEAPMSRDDRIALQARMAALGYAVDNREGRISLALRDVIRLAQAKVGLVPDGNPTRSLLAALAVAR